MDEEERQRTREDLSLFTSMKPLYKSALDRVSASSTLPVSPLPLTNMMVMSGRPPRTTSSSTRSLPKHHQHIIHVQKNHPLVPPQPFSMNHNERTQRPQTARQLKTNHHRSEDQPVIATRWSCHNRRIIPKRPQSANSTPSIPKSFLDKHSFIHTQNNYPCFRPPPFSMNDVNNKDDNHNHGHDEAVERKARPQTAREANNKAANTCPRTSQQPVGTSTRSSIPKRPQSASTARPSSKTGISKVSRPASPWRLSRQQPNDAAKSNTRTLLCHTSGAIDTISLEIMKREVQRQREVTASANKTHNNLKHTHDRLKAELDLLQREWKWIEHENNVQEYHTMPAYKSQQKQREELEATLGQEKDELRRCHAYLGLLDHMLKRLKCERQAAHASGNQYRNRRLALEKEYGPIHSRILCHFHFHHLSLSLSSSFSSSTYLNLLRVNLLSRSFCMLIKIQAHDIVEYISQWQHIYSKFSPWHLLKTHLYCRP
jgi:hypothetical protein